MASRNSKQDELYDRFKQYSGLSNKHLDFCRDVILAAEYRFIDSDGDSDSYSVDDDRLDIRVKHLKADGSEFTLADIPMKSLVDAIEDHIQMYIPEYRRTEVYKKVVEGVHGIKQTPKWDRQADNPRAVPQTPFSESRDPPESRKTNEVLFRKFASASELERETLAHIRGMIVWRDSARSNGTWGAIEWGTFEVTGGRLGPTEDHSLADVPNCYVRDRLMAAISADVDPDRGGQVWKIVFSDLTSSQIKEYAATIDEMERQAEPHKPAKTRKSRKSRGVFDRAMKVREIQYSRKICPQEAEAIMKQEELLDAIDDTINLAPNPSFTALKMKPDEFHPSCFSWRTKYSVSTPNTQVKGDAEATVPSGCDIDRDCDQVRAMIKILVRKGHWTMEQFTHALEGPRRPQITKFLEKRGPLQGKQSEAFRRCWDFFKRRELLGFELTDPPPRPSGLAREVRELTKLREVDPNHGTKRPSLKGSERPGKVRKV
ncbi:hypothetical protein F5Y10DRAFT_120335 [Nemania abortiva]|nr:hypothetical protein F5Y10DRAFT_120335 [Nemania abortiva]